MAKDGQGEVGSILLALRLNSASFVNDINVTKAEARRAAREIKEEIGESNHTLALTGELFGVTVPRHIRGFISELPGVSKAMSAAFNVAAVGVLASVLFEAGKKVYELAEKLKQAGEASEKLREGFKKVDETLEDGAHQLDLQIAKLDATIARLEKKPQNGLALALAQAAVAADNLNKKLLAALESSQKVLKSQDQGVFMKILTGKSGTDSSQKIAKWVQEELEKLPHDANYSTEANKILRKGWDKAQEQLGLNAKFNDGQRLLQESAHLHGSTIRDVDFSTENTALYELQKSLSDMYEVSDKSTELDRKQAEVDRLQGEKVRGETPAQKFMAKANADYADLQSSTGASGAALDALDEWSFWREKLTAAQAGGKELEKAREEVERKLGQLTQRYSAEQQRQHQETLRHAAEFSASWKAALDKLEEAQGKHLEKMRELQAVGARIRLEAGFAKEEREVSRQQSRGEIGEQQAAQLLAGIHKRIIQAELDELNGELAKIASSGLTPDQKLERSEQVNNQIEQAKARAAETADRDKEAQHIVTVNEAMGRLALTLDEAGSRAGEFWASLANSGLQGMNTNLIAAMSGRKTNWGGMFQKMGDDALGFGLKRIESGAMKALGIGKPDGSRSNPIYTRSADAIGNALKSAGHAGAAAGGDIGSAVKSIFNGHDFGKLGPSLAKLGHMFGGFFADGGAPDPYSISVVGERGPELFMPKQAGTVIPNSRLRGLTSGGSMQQTINVDARGTNAADVDYRVRRACAVTRAQTLAEAEQQRIERNARVPAHLRA